MSCQSYAKINLNYLVNGSKKKNSKKATRELGASASFSVSSGSKKFEMFNDQNI